MYLNVGIIHPYRFSELDDGLLDRVTQQTDSHGTVLAGLLNRAVSAEGGRK
jgi:hypothetical protein